MKLARRKLAFRLVLPIVASTIAIFCVFSILLFQSFHSLVLLELEERAKSLSETFTLGVENNASNTVAIKLSSLLGSSEDIDSLMIIDLMSERVIGSNRWELSGLSIYEVEHLTSYVTYLNGRTSYFYEAPNSKQGILISKIKTFSPDRITRRHLALFAIIETERLTTIAGGQYKQVTFLLAFSLVLLACLVYAATFVYVVRPLSRMTVDIQHGQVVGLMTLIRYRSPDELGRLAQTYNNHVMDAYRANLSQKISMEKINEVSKAKSIFLSTMSHEIRTPMNGVLGMVQLLSKTELTDYQKRCIDLIKTSGEALVEIINDVLDFSKIEANKLELENVFFSLEKLCVDILGLLKSQAREKGVHLYLHYDLDVPTEIMGDPVRMRQVIINLLGNAIKFTHQGSVGLSVSFETVNEVKNLAIAVSDTGVGITEEKQQRLFEAFSQADTSTTRKYGGTGLGLAISKKIVELMQGAITVTSESGRGSVFKIAIPSVQGRHTPFVIPKTDMNIILIAFPWYLEKILCSYFNYFNLNVITLHFHEEIDKTEQMDSSVKVFIFAQNIDLEAIKNLYNHVTKPIFVVEFLDVFLSLPDDILTNFIEVPCFNKQWLDWLNEQQQELSIESCQHTQEDALSGKILLAEDAPVNQIVAQELLEAMNFEVVIANDGLEAIQLIQQERDIRLVLMDCMMPNMDGYEATRKIRLFSEPLGSIPIIALTANIIQEAKDECMAAGMNDFLSKPFSEDELKTILIRWLGQENDRDADCENPSKRINS